MTTDENVRAIRHPINRDSEGAKEQIDSFLPIDSAGRDHSLPAVAALREGDGRRSAPTIDQIGPRSKTETRTRIAPSCELLADARACPGRLRTYPARICR